MTALFARCFVFASARTKNARRGFRWSRWTSRTFWRRSAWNRRSARRRRRSDWSGSKSSDCSRRPATLLTTTPFNRDTNTFTPDSRTTCRSSCCCGQTSAPLGHRGVWLDVAFKGGAGTRNSIVRFLLVHSFSTLTWGVCEWGSMDPWQFLSKQQWERWKGPIKARRETTNFKFLWPAEGLPNGMVRVELFSLNDRSQVGNYFCGCEFE